MELSFGYSSPVKKIAKICAYTGKEFGKSLRPTFEHILPHSKGGANGIANCLATTATSNHARGNMRFDKWLRLNPGVTGHIQNYLNNMRGIKIDDTDYVEAVKKTLNREARGVAAFAGNKMNIKF